MILNIREAHSGLGATSTTAGTTSTQKISGSLELAAHLRALLTNVKVDAAMLAGREVDQESVVELGEIG